jgi:hypothetical protein
MDDGGNFHFSTLLIEWNSDTAYDMTYIRKPEHNHVTPERYMYTYMVVLSSFVLNHAESTLFEVPVRNEKYTWTWTRTRPCSDTYDEYSSNQSVWY